MPEYVLSIDPGVSTGVALLSFEADSPADLVEGWQFTGGVSGFLEWRDKHTYEYIEGCEVFSVAPHDRYRVPNPDDGLILGGFSNDWTRCVTVIAEKFTARTTKGFSYTTASLEPLRGEGALIALGLMPDYTLAEKRWRDPKLQYLVGGKDLPDKKKRMHAFLNDVGMRRTNKDFPESPTKDGADDFRSACAHGVNYIARELKHKPTFDMIARWGEEN